MSKSNNAEVTIRRAPKYLGFAITGVFLGVLVAVVMGLVFGEILPMIIIYFAAGFGALGIVVGLLFDAYFRARTRTLQATKITE